jgi:D-sedoheptulose 7-phosphate isomerase
MTDPRTDEIENHFQRSCAALERAARDVGLRTAILAIADRIGAVLRAGGKLMLAGNGGSAADAQHIAAEFLSRFGFDRAPLAAVALTTDTSVLTAIGNDYGLRTSIRAAGAWPRARWRRPHRHLNVRSPSVLRALIAARETGIGTIGFTGSRETSMQPLCDLILAAPAKETALIQQIHIEPVAEICTGR